MTESTSWVEKSLGELVQFQTGKLNSNAATEHGKYPFFTCSRETFRTDTYSFDGEAVLLAGNNAKGIYPVKYYSGRFDAYQRTYVITSNDTDVLLNRFLYYALQPKLEMLQSLSTGAATKFLTLTILQSVRLQLPPNSTQKHISAVLSAYDDLIENNTRRIAILEEMAGRLYEEWFVSFRFPGHESVEFVGDLPTGWSIGQLTDIAEQAGSSVNPSNEPEQIYAHFSFPAFDASASPEITRGGTIMSNKFQFTGPAVLLAKLNPRIERVWTVLKDHEHPMVASTEFIPLVPRDGSSVALIEAVVRSRSFRDYLLGLSGGTSTSHQRVKPKEALAGSIFLAPLELRERAILILDPLLRQRDALQRENENLTAQRNLLLPRLVSGEIDVSAALGELEAAE